MRTGDGEFQSGGSTRRNRQGAVILALIAARDLHRAADLAHEHLAEFHDDRALRQAIVTALSASSDPRLCLRAAELATPSTGPVDGPGSA